MPTDLGIRYFPTWNGYPPHISPEDLEIWKRYHTFVLGEAINLYFDVGLGGPENIPPDTTEEMKRMWIRTNQKRADVVVEAQNHWTIIELRHYASAAALGRLLMYRDLWRKEPPDDKPVMLRLVSDGYDKDVKATAEALGIEYIII